MKILATSIALLTAACIHPLRAQNQIPTAVFPGGVVTDEQLKVQVNGSQTNLTASLSAAGTLASVASCSYITANMFATINTEVIAVSGCSGSSLTIDTASPGCTSGRACDGTTATAHSSGAPVQLFIVAWHHNSLAKEVEAIEAAINPSAVVTYPGYIANVVGLSGSAKTFKNSDNSFTIGYLGIVGIQPVGNQTALNVLMGGTAGHAAVFQQTTSVGTATVGITNLGTDFALTAGASAISTVNYIATENGSNNAIACSSGGPALVPGLVVTVQLAHTLQAGANTFAYLGGSALAIKSSFNTSNNIATGYAATGVITLQYNGTLWVDLKQ